MFGYYTLWGAAPCFMGKWATELRAQGSSAGGLTRLRQPAWGEQLLQPGGYIKP